MATEIKASRSEREANIKDKAGWVITILAALLAINTLIGSSNSNKILSNTIAANNIWAFYQAKSIKQTSYEIASVEARARGDSNRADEYKSYVEKYESDPKTGEGKKELMASARHLDSERADARIRSPWYTYAGSLLQIAIVLLTASILAVSDKLYKASIGVGIFAAIMISQAFWLWLPIVI